MGRGRTGHPLDARPAHGLLKGFPSGKMLREKFQHVSTLAGVDAIAQEHLQSMVSLVAA